MSKVTAKLNDWYEQSLGGGDKVIWGNIEGDTRGRFADGVLVRTSFVSKVEDGFAYTLNSVYQLGEQRKH